MVNAKALSQKELRKIRVEKVKELRFKKLHSLTSSSPLSTPQTPPQREVIVIKSEPPIKCSSKKDYSYVSLSTKPSKNDILAERRIRNRQSAYNSRMKKVHEMEEMSTRIRNLEIENQNLKSILIQFMSQGYQPSTFHQPTQPQYSETIQHLVSSSPPPPHQQLVNYNNSSTLYLSTTPSSLGTHCANIEPAMF